MNHDKEIILITGLAGSGKTTVAKYLQEVQGYFHLKFATPIKEMMVVLGLSPDELELQELKETPHPLLHG